MGKDECGDENDETSATQADIPDAALSLNAILELLAHHHRRWILRVLSDASDHTATLDGLVEHLIKQETERTGEQLGRDQIEMQLHHIHLPKLTEAGVIEYDTRSQELRYWRHDRLEEFLDYVHSHEAE